MNRIMICSNPNECYTTARILLQRNAKVVIITSESESAFGRHGVDFNPNQLDGYWIITDIGSNITKLWQNEMMVYLSSGEHTIGDLWIMFHDTYGEYVPDSRVVILGSDDSIGYEIREALHETKT